MRWDKLNGDSDRQLNFRLSFDAGLYAVGVFLFPFLAIHSLSDFARLWWLFIPAVILSGAVYLTVRGLKKSSYVKKPLNLSDSE